MQGRASEAGGEGQLERRVGNDVRRDLHREEASVIEDLGFEVWVLV